MRVRLALFSFYLNGGLQSVLSGNLLNGCQIFGRFGFLKTEYELNFGFPHIPSILYILQFKTFNRTTEYKGIKLCNKLPTDVNISALECLGWGMQASIF